MRWLQTHLCVRCGGREVLEDVFGRGHGEDHRGLAARVLVDQQHLDGAGRALQTDLVLPRPVVDLGNKETV